MDTQQFFESIEDTLVSAFELMKPKNADYGVTTDPFKNFRDGGKFAHTTPQQQIMSRLGDKMSRISNLLAPGKETAVKEESVEDTILDAINYLAILKVWREANPQTGVAQSAGPEPSVSPVAQIPEDVPVANEVAKAGNWFTRFVGAAFPAVTESTGPK